MRHVQLYAANTVISIVAGFIGAIPGTVPLMWLMALLHEHVFPGIAPAGQAMALLPEQVPT